MARRITVQRTVPLRSASPRSATRRTSRSLAKDRSHDGLTVDFHHSAPRHAPRRVAAQRNSTHQPHNCMASIFSILKREQQMRHSHAAALTPLPTEFSKKKPALKASNGHPRELPIRETSAAFLSEHRADVAE